jgi:hypothetical protein
METNLKNLYEEVVSEKLSDVRLMKASQIKMEI